MKQRELQTRIAAEPMLDKRPEAIAAELEVPPSVIPFTGVGR